MLSIEHFHKTEYFLIMPEVEFFFIQKHIIKSENIVAHGEELRCHLNYSSIKSPIAVGKHLESLLFLLLLYLNHLKMAPSKSSSF